LEELIIKKNYNTNIINIKSIIDTLKMYNLNSNNKINYSEKHKNLSNKAKKYKTSISLELLHND